MTRQLAMPWAPNQRAYCLPGSVIVKAALGEAPESIPASADVRRGQFAAAQSFDGHGVVDRICRHFAGQVLISRLHGAAASMGRPGARHLGFNDREHVLGLARTFRFDVPPGTAIAPFVDSLNQITTVEAASPNYLTVTPFEAVAVAADESATWRPWDMVRALEALAYESGDSATILAIIDSGVARSHRDLPQLRAGYDTVQLGRGDVATGLELLGDTTALDRSPVDRYVGHGMACAGIIGALGLGMPPGVAGATQILPIRALGAARFPGKPQPVGIGAASDLDMAIKIAVDLGAKVLNMSFGTDDAVLDPAAEKPHADVVAYALERGCVLVAASGNSGGETRYWPAAYPGVIAVGSVDADGRPSAFSTRGEHVALCAPGERIRSLGLTGYQDVTGTSFAAPFAAATAALLVARAQGRSTPLDSETVCSLLASSAAPFTGPRISGCGAGVLDAAAALQELDAWLDRTLPSATEDVDDG
jgi:subtilisin family serine protease